MSDERAKVAETYVRVSADSKPFQDSYEQMITVVMIHAIRELAFAMLSAESARKAWGSTSGDRLRTTFGNLTAEELHQVANDWEHELAHSFQKGILDA